VGCYIWYSEDGPERAAAPPSPLFAVANVTAHPSTASVLGLITVLLYDGSLICGFNVAIRGLSTRTRLYAMLLFFCLSVRLSPVKFLKSFATWQHLAASGAYRIDSDTLVLGGVCTFISLLPSTATASEFFCRAMLCISAAYAVVRYVSVCSSRSCILSKRVNMHIFEIFFSLSGSHTIVVFPYQALWHDSDRDPLIGAKSLFSTDTRSMTDTASSKVITLSGGVCVSRKRTTKCQNFVYDTKPGRRFYQSTGIG